MKPHLRKLPHVLGGSLRGADTRRVLRVTDSSAYCSNVRLRISARPSQWGEGLSEEIHGSLDETAVRKANADGLVNVQHIDIVVPREFVQCGAIRVFVDVAGKVARGVERRGSRSAGDVDGCGRVLGAVPSLC